MDQDKASSSPLDRDEYDKCPDKSPDSGAEAGSLRGFLRSYITRFAKRASIGSLPLHSTLPSPAKLGRAASGLGQVVDVTKAATQATTDVERHKKKKDIFSTMKATAPVLIKNSLLGAVQFAVYDSVVSKLKALWTTTITTSMQQPQLDQQDQQERRMVPIALTAGLVSGCMHGGGHLAWDHGASMLRNSIPDNNHVKKKAVVVVSRSGTLVLHSLSHATLFGTYALVKYICQSPMDSSSSSSSSSEKSVRMATQVLTIGLSGFIAGCAEELVSHRLGYLERLKQHRPPAGAAGVGPIALRTLLVAGVPSTIGFLAMEFGG